MWNIAYARGVPQLISQQHASICCQYIHEKKFIRCMKTYNESLTWYENALCITDPSCGQSTGQPRKGKLMQIFVFSLNKLLKKWGGRWCDMH